MGLGVPRSTLRQWLKQGVGKVITLPEFEMTQHALIEENLRLKKEIKAFEAKEELNLITKKIFRIEIQFRRLPGEESKKTLLLAIEKAKAVIALKECLATIGMSLQRFRQWQKRAVRCDLPDHSSCPRVSPTRLLPAEVKMIGELFRNSAFSHFSITSLSLLAKRTNTVMASLSTWYRVIRENGFKRSFQRHYPPKPKVGIRAAFACQIWHLDLTIIRLEDGTRAFIQCVIDNYSRFVLAWHVSQEYGGVKTKELLIKAISKARELGLQLIPNVFVDSGCENINEHVDSLVAVGLLRRTIAQIDVQQSNSMIEALFLRLKHYYLYYLRLTDFAELSRGVDYYLTQANEFIPLAALNGATPIEAITGGWTEIQIAAFKDYIKEAKLKRISVNRSMRCSPCLA